MNACVRACMRACVRACPASSQLHLFALCPAATLKQNACQDINTSTGQIVRGFTREWGEGSSGTKCISDDTWVDSQGATCYTYSRLPDMCNAGVEYMPPYLVDHDPFVDGYTDDAKGAKQACCVCGGGRDIEINFLPTTVSEEDCLEECLRMDGTPLFCTSVMHAPLNDSNHHIAGQCWISTRTNPNETLPEDELWLHPSLSYDHLWSMESVVHQPPRIVQEFCDDSTFSLSNASSERRRWTDRYNRSCHDYRRLGLCDASSPDSGILFTFPSVPVVNRYQTPLPNGTLVWKDNITYTKEWTNFFPLYGSAWDFLNVTGQGGPSFAGAQATRAEGYPVDFGPASGACCGCGKIAEPLGFNTFVRRPGNVTLDIAKVSDLVCSPELHNTLSAAETPCDGQLMIEMQDEVGVPRCCFRPNASLFLVLETCDGEICRDQGALMEIIDYNISSVNGWVIADGISLLAAKTAGAQGQTARLISTQTVFGSPNVDGPESVQGAILRPVVEGRIFHVTIKKRGAGYTTDPYLLVWPTVRPEHHNTSMWDAADERTHSFFRHARLGFSIGYPGDVAGTFDGRNISYMCDLADDPSVRSECRANPYGAGFGACIAMTRASGAEVAASTTAVDLANATDLETAGAASIAAFRIGEVQFLAVANYLNASELDFTGGSPLGPFSSPSFGQRLDRAYRARSQLFRVDADSHGRLHTSLVQEFETVSANHVSHSITGGHHVLAFSEEMANVSQLYALPEDSSPHDLSVEGGSKFRLIQRIPTHGARAMYAYETSPSYGAETVFLLAQTGDAQQCALQDQLSPDPLCGKEGSGIAEQGKVSLQQALDLALAPGQSMMLRWNGTRAQGTNIMETLPSDLAGGQAFVSHKATDFVPFRSRDGSDHAMLLNFEESDICQDDPHFGCENFRNDTLCAEYVSAGSLLCRENTLSLRALVWC